MAIFNALFWREPLWMLLALMPALPLLLNISLRGGNKSLADTHLMPWVVHQQSTSLLKFIFSKNSAYIFSWILIGLAAAGPRLPSDISKHNPTVNIDIMLVVDVSRSMHITDVQPSRLRRAKIEIEEFLARANGARVGIIVFSARPHLLAPLTFDHEAVRHYLQSLDSLTLPTNGSDPIAAINLAHNELNSSTTPSAIVVISDGDFSEAIKSENNANVMPADIPIYALGIGSTEGDAILAKKGEWLKYQGRPVISRLNENNLQLLTKQKASGSGNEVGVNKNNNKKYSAVSDSDSDWAKLYDNGISKLAYNVEETHGKEIVWDELFFWPLAPALVLLWVSLTPFGFRKKYQHHHSNSRIRGPVVNYLTMALLVMCIGIGNSQTAHAKNFPTVDVKNELKIFHAYKKYNKGEYPAAILLYKNITGYDARLGEGSCYYKLEDFDTAIRQYTQAVLIASDDKKRATAIFNLANAHFKAANYAEAASIYADAARYNPMQKGVQHNLELSSTLKNAVERRLKQARQTSHAGSGPQLAQASEAMENSQSSSLAIDQSSSLSIFKLPLPGTSNISSAELEALIQKGLKRIQLADHSSGASAYKNTIINKLSIINARLMMIEQEDQQVELWKRLFEMEEGFSAPQSAPHDIPGVAPW